MSYKDLLRDPRWQRKRLGIFQRDNFACVACGAKDKELQVHHGYYGRGLMPWEHPAATLHTVCPDCHISWQSATAILHAIIGAAKPRSLEGLIHSVIDVVAAEREMPGSASFALSKAEWAAIVGEFGKATEWFGLSDKLTGPTDE